MSVSNLINGSTPNSIPWANLVVNNIACNDITCASINVPTLSDQSILLKAPSNQITIRPNGVGTSMIINGTNPGSSNITYNLPDISATDNTGEFIMDTGDQTITGEKIFSNSINLTAIEDQIIITPGGGGSDFHITCTNPVNPETTITIPDPGMSFGTEFVLTEGSRTINGNTSFTQVTTVNILNVASNIQPTGQNLVVQLPDNGTSSFLVQNLALNPVLSVAGDGIVETANCTLDDGTGRIICNGSLQIKQGGIIELGTSPNQFVITGDSTTSPLVYNIPNVLANASFLLGISDVILLNGVDYQLTQDDSGKMIRLNNGTGVNHTVTLPISDTQDVIDGIKYTFIIDVLAGVGSSYTIHGVNSVTIGTINGVLYSGNAFIPVITSMHNIILNSGLTSGTIYCNQVDTEWEVSGGVSTGFPDIQFT